MYEFIDVNEVSAGAYLPAEALMLNGEYIENLIDGYRTLAVTGREALTPELNTFETGIRDGAKLLNRRYPARTIIVKYQLIAKSNEAFREAYNKLGEILNVEDAELIFNDEQDKYFKGTPSLIGEVDAGRNAVVGEIEFTCNDPFKYSVIEYEAEAALADGSILIDYNGTYKSFPVLEAEFYNEAENGETETTLTGNGDCGYVAFFNESEKIIQLGDPDEADVTDGLAKSQTLINQTFLSNTAWGTTAKKLWTVNDSTPLPVTVTKVGTVAMAAAATASTTAASTSGTLLTITSNADVPAVNYVIKAQATNRTENSVKVAIAITTSLGRDASWIGNGVVMTGSVYIGGAWHDVTIKKGSEYWKGRTGHTVNLNVTVTGLSSTTASITGIKFKVANSYDATGTLAATNCNNLAISPYASAEASAYYLKASSYGSGSAWHGPSITRSIGADAAGVTGAANFIFTYKQKMCIGNGSNDTKQLGGFHCYLTDANNKTVAGVRIVKTKADKFASLMLFVNGVKVHQVGIDISYYNKYFGCSEKSVQTSTIRKDGSQIVFNIGGYRQVFTEDAVKDLAVTKVTFMFEQYGTNTALSYNGLFYAKFTKNNCSTYKDIPNKFGANDVLEADCKDGSVYLNGILSPDLGALGNDWEGFYLTKGLNQIGVAYSEWVTDAYAPTFKVRYREVFL